MTRNITIRIEVTDEELTAINARTTPRQRAQVLAALAAKIQEAEQAIIQEQSATNAPDRGEE